MLNARGRCGVRCDGSTCREAWLQRVHGRSDVHVVSDWVVGKQSLLECKPRSVQPACTHGTETWQAGLCGEEAQYKCAGPDACPSQHRILGSSQHFRRTWDAQLGRAIPVDVKLLHIMITVSG
eukprot:1560887-Rhodomonas_salina.1